MNVSEDLKRIMLAGIGAVATTAEKSKEVVDALVSKGEITVEQGKVLNEELKRNISDTFNKHVTAVKEQVDVALHPKTDILAQLDTMNADELAALKKKLAEMENQQDEAGESGE